MFDMRQPGCGKRPVLHPMRQCADPGRASKCGAACGGRLESVFPDKHNELGRVLIFPDQIVAVECDFIRNSNDYMSNFLNNAVVTLRLPVSQIASGKKARFRINPNAYYITMRNGETYVMIFDNPRTTIPVLDAIINGK